MRTVRLVLWTAGVAALTFTLAACAPSSWQHTPGFSGPLVITSGGTYSGKWESLNPDVPAVEIRTEEPVVIRDAVLRGPGHLIDATHARARLIVRNVEGYGVNPNLPWRSPGRFLSAYRVRSVLVEHSYMEKTAGVYIDTWVGDAAQRETITVRYNTALNIEGRFSNGKGGWQSAAAMAQFVMLNNVNGIRGASISWNRVENRPGESRVEDNISLHMSSGTPDSPIVISDNLIHGAYGWPLGAHYTGGGIMLGDSCGSSAFSEAVRNTVLETSNYGIAVSGGREQRVRDNVILGRGALPDGTPLEAEPDAGIYLRDYCATPGRNAASVIAEGNTVGWFTVKFGKERKRVDLHNMTGTLGKNTLVGDGEGPITAAMIEAAIAAWEKRAVASNITVGLVAKR